MSGVYTESYSQYDTVNENFNFKLLHTFVIEELINSVSSFTDEWDADTSRQTQFKTHSDTKSIILQDAPVDWRCGTPFEPIKTDPVNLWDLVSPIVSFLETAHDGISGKVLLAKLNAKGKIPPHDDMGDYLRVNRRNHIPLITNENVFFSVGDETISMKVGECWEINNARKHSVDNNSELDRVHLIVDIVPNKVLNHVSE